MNKTVNINLASTFFHIDENAYKKLQSYLNSLEKGFKNTMGKEEILKDIEARIAELFQEMKTNSDYVINESNVEKVISILGEPEDFMSDDEDTTPPKESSHKKLYRDPEDKYIAGVASGLGYYFGLDTSWIRVLWLLLILFSGGTFLLIYFLFWILVPVAKTTADKLKMKGEPVNISTIEKKIKQEFEEVSSKIKDIDYDKASKTLKKKSKDFFGFLEEVLKTITKIIFKLIGFLFVLVSTITIIGLFIGGLVLLFFGTLIWPFHLFDFGLFPNAFWMIAVFLFLLIPFLFLFSLGIRILRGHSSTFGTLGRFVLLGLWIMSIISFVWMSSNTIRNQRITATKSIIQPLDISIKDTLFISVWDTDFKSAAWEFKKTKPFRRIFREFDENVSIIKLSIQGSNDSKSHLKLNTSAKGYDQKKAQENVEAINYDWNLEENVLYLGNHFDEEKRTFFGSNKIDLTLLLAEDQIFYLNTNLGNMLTKSIDNDQGLRPYRTTGHYWKMRANELECLDCSENQSRLELQYQDDKGKEKLHLEVDENGIQLKTK